MLSTYDLLSMFTFSKSDLTKK